MNNDIIKGFDEGYEESIKIRLERIGQVSGCLLLHLCGYIDSSNCHHLEKKAQMAVEAGFTRLVFEMRDVTYVSSTGVGSLVFFLKSLRSKAGDLVLQEVRPRVLEVFTLLGLANFFLRSDCLEESIARLVKEPVPAAFPRIFACPACDARLRAGKAGTFRCPRCHTILALAATGDVAVGRAAASGAAREWSASGARLNASCSA